MLRNSPEKLCCSRSIGGVVTLIASLALPETAAAHSFGRIYTLPIPLEYYGWAASIVLVVSFVIAALFARSSERQTSFRQLEINASGPAWAVFFLTLQGLCLALLVLAVLSGFVGHPNSNVNVNMTLFWIVFVLGFAYFSALIGGLFERINPLENVTEGLARCLAWVIPKFRNGVFQYPATLLGYWPATLLYLGFIWVELFGRTTPFVLSQWLLGYALFNVVGALVFGSRPWFRYVELFSVFLRLLSMCSPLCLQRQRSVSDSSTSTTKAWRWSIRWPFSGLVGKTPEHVSLVAFVLCTLAATAYDGFHETVPWLRFFWSTFIPWLDPGIGWAAVQKYRSLLTYWQWGGLLVAAISYFFLYFLAVWLGKLLARSHLGLGYLLRSFSYSLIPIALVYHASHYYSLVETEGPRIFPLLSDPFGKGWDLFGTADWFRYSIIPDMEITWHAQVGLIVIGHIVSVIIAHKAALAVFDDRRSAALSQIPMLFLMIAYTVAGLWILALPLETPRLM